MARTTDEPTGSMWFQRRAWLVGIGLVVVQAALFSWNLDRAYRQALDGEYARLADAARIADDNIGGRLRAIDLLLRDVAAELERRGNTESAAVSQYMATRALAFPEVKVVLVTNAAGVIVASNRAEIVGWDLHERSNYIRVREAPERNKTYFSPLTLGKSNAVNIIVATRALPAPAGQWAGVVSVSLDIQVFDALLTTIRPDDPSSAVLIAGLDGRVISQVPGGERFVGVDISKDEDFAGHRAAGQILTVHRFTPSGDPVERISAVRTMADGWYVLIAQRPVVDALASWRSQALTQGLTFLVVALSLLSLTWLIVRQYGRESVATTLAVTAQDRIDYLSRYDPLTALPNLRMLEDYFEIARGSAARSGNGMALISCNLDNFKHINDTLGHAAGDSLLREVAKRLNGCVAIGTGDIVCRVGGDEFLIVLVDVPTWDAVHASIYAMRAVVSVPVELGRHPVSLTASFGISRYPDDGETFDILFRKADAAVYHAKQAGRNTTRQFEATMMVYASERLTLKNDLRLAIERDEFFLHYQPLVDLASGRITGAEALLRWQSPDHGFVPPARFIPIAEETGLIVPIGKWVLAQVCRQGRLWRDAGLPNLRLAVNISVIQLHSPDFVETLKQLVQDSGLPPEWLELELTESVLISEVDHTLAVINELKAFGVRFAIDDFGTGYSCLAYLQKLKTDKLKIDRSFVTELGSDAESAAIVTTIIQMAETMNMTTLAEGVETEAQAEMLKRYGCKEVQGYLFGRPVTVEEFRQRVLSSVEAAEPEGGAGLRVG